MARHYVGMVRFNWMQVGVEDGTSNLVTFIGQGYVFREDARAAIQGILDMSSAFGFADLADRFRRSRYDEITDGTTVWRVYEYEVYAGPERAAFEWALQYGRVLRENGVAVAEVEKPRTETMRRRRRV